MRILICSGIFPPEAGGPATYSKLLAEEMAKRGHEVRVITYGGGNLKVSATSSGDVAEGFSPPPVVRIRRSWFKPWHYYKFFRAVKKYGKDCDVLYAQGPVSDGYPTYLAAKSLKKPFAIKVTGDYSWEQAMNRGLTEKLIDEFQTLQEYPKAVRRMRDIQIRVCKEASAVIAPSEYLKRIVLGWGVKEKRIKVIYNSVPTMSGLSREDARGKLQISPDDFYVVSAGRNVPWKGFGVLRESVEELQKEHPDIRMEIVTKLPHSTTMLHLAAADIFILNSSYEGLSHLILEAMTLGTPVAASRVGGNPELISDGQTGMLFQYNNREEIKEVIRKLYNSEGLRQKLKQGASKFFEELKINLQSESMITKTLEVLKSICAS